MSDVHAVILAGGSGTRFWPASRQQRPKQLLRIGPDHEHSLIAATVRRIEALVPPDRTFIATGAHLVAATRAALPGLPAASFLGEPYARNTAPCIAWATAVIARRDPNATIMVLPSDHHVTDEPAFRQTLETALSVARTGTITTIGVEPTRPETGYGYIEKGAEVRPGVHQVERFVEKPDRARAEEYLASGRYLWNGGMFFFTAQAMLAAVARHMPELAAGIERIDAAAAQGEAAERHATEEVFANLSSTSIDYGVMEKEAALCVVPGSFGWSDLGSWETAWELARRDADGNAVEPGNLVLSGKNNLVVSLGATRAERVVVAIGVDDLCIVDTDDAVLVLPRARAQDVRLAVEALRQAGRTDKL